MGRIAVTEDVEGLRDEQEMDDSDMGGGVNDLSTPEAETGDEPMDIQQTMSPKRKFVATIHEVNEAFDSVNTLRYSQPTHLQGTPPSRSLSTVTADRQTQGSAKASLSPPSAPVTHSVVQSGKSALPPPERSSMP